ncbi:MAG: hypothetical protein NTU49_09570 [Gammaproteobacteria bacterium]|nr:hypothetical protein [Gammaproteobacteria bacterium]
MSPSTTAVFDTNSARIATEIPLTIILLERRFLDSYFNQLEVFMIKKMAYFTAFSAILVCLTTQAMAGTAAASMHYGKQTIAGTDAPIVITNCSDQSANVSADFTDGSSKEMPIYPVFQYPMNIISICESAPYVMIEVDALDGTVLFPQQAVYPGQDVNIGCSAEQKLSHKMTVAVTQ